MHDREYVSEAKLARVLSCLLAEHCTPCHMLLHGETVRLAVVAFPDAWRTPWGDCRPGSLGDIRPGSLGDICRCSCGSWIGEPYPVKAQVEFQEGRSGFRMRSSHEVRMWWQI